MAGKDDSNLKKSKVTEQIADTLVRVEIFKKNDKTFDGRLSRDDLVKVWTEALRQDPLLIDGVASIQIRGFSLRINYRLKKAVVPSKIFKKPDFEWEKTLPFGQFEWFSGRILGLFTDEASIGDTVTVCVNRTALEFNDSQIEDWLLNFGTVAGSFNYLKDKNGLKTDNLEVEVTLRKHIPEYLPMYGRRIRIYYLGMQKQCNNCFELGHIKSACEEEKKDWFSFIEELIDSGDYKKSLFGDWPEVIQRKRKQLRENSRGKGRGAKGRGSSKEDNEDKKVKATGRGRGRGRGAKN
jgi:hypothetical protein